MESLLQRAASLAVAAGEGGAFEVDFVTFVFEGADGVVAVLFNEAGASQEEVAHDVRDGVAFVVGYGFEGFAEAGGKAKGDLRGVGFDGVAWHGVSLTQSGGAWFDSSALFCSALGAGRGVGTCRLAGSRFLARFYAKTTSLFGVGGWGRGGGRCLG